MTIWPPFLLTAGFVRLAIEQQAALVPVVCLGEIGALENLFNWPALQQWTYKNIGFPIPFLLVGRWGLTPFPRQTGLRFVVGDPIPCPPQIPGEKVGFCASLESLFTGPCAELKVAFFCKACSKAWVGRSHCPRLGEFQGIKFVSLMSYSRDVYTAPACEQNFAFHFSDTIGLQVDNEVVDSLHRKYYQAVEALYRKHQHQVPGYAHKKFVLVWTWRSYDTLSWELQRFKVDAEQLTKVLKLGLTQHSVQIELILNVPDDSNV